MLTIGQKAPDFTLSDKDGNAVSLSDFAGKKVVLYFYPKDNTPGCTRQACAFAAAYEGFKAKDVAVIGISKDSMASHLKFAQKYDLPFVAFNQGSICHLDNAGTMHFSVNWKKPWTIPTILKQTSVRQREMEHMGAAYMAEGLVTLAGSRLYTSAAYTEEMIDDVLARFEKVLANVGPLEE